MSPDPPNPPPPPPPPPSGAPGWGIPHTGRDWDAVHDRLRLASYSHVSRSAPVSPAAAPPAPGQPPAPPSPLLSSAVAAAVARSAKTALTASGVAARKIDPLTLGPEAQSLHAADPKKFAAFYKLLSGPATGAGVDPAETIYGSDATARGLAKSVSAAYSGRSASNLLTSLLGNSARPTGRGGGPPDEAGESGGGYRDRPGHGSNKTNELLEKIERGIERLVGYEALGGSGRPIGLGESRGLFGGIFRNLHERSAAGWMGDAFRQVKSTGMELFRRSPIGKAARSVNRALRYTAAGRAVRSGRIAARRLGRYLRGTAVGRVAGGLSRGVRALMFGTRASVGGGGHGGEGGGAAAAAGGEGGAAAEAGSTLKLLGKFGGGLAVAVEGLFKLGKAAVDVAYGQEEKMKELAKYSPSQAMNLAALEMGRIQRAQDKGEATAGSGKMLTESLDKFEESLQPLSTALDNLLNSVGSGVLDVLTDGVGLLTKLVKEILDIINAIGRQIVDGLNNAFGAGLAWEDIGLKPKPPEKRPDLYTDLKRATAGVDAQVRELSRQMDEARRQHDAKFGRVPR